MPKYLGPYEAIQPDGETGQIFHVGDEVTETPERIRHLQVMEGYRFEEEATVVSVQQPVGGEVVVESSKKKDA